MEEALIRCGLRADTVKKFVEEDFDKNSFLKVTPATLRVLGFTGREIVEVMGIIAQNPEGFDNLTPDNSNEMAVASDAKDADEDEMDVALTPYFTKAALKDTSLYDKQVMCTQLTNWLKIKEQTNDPALIAAMKPKFLKVAVEKKKSPFKKRRAAEASEPVSSCAPKRVTRSSGQGPSEYRPVILQSVPASEPEPSDINSRSSGQGPSEYRPVILQSVPGPEPEPSNINSRSTNNNNTLQSLTNIDSQPSTSRGCSYETQTVQTTLKISWKQRELPLFDVKDVVTKILPQERRGKVVLERLNQNDTLESADRKLIVRALTKWLYFNHASDPKHVTTDMKDGLAKSIYNTYPTSFSLLVNHDENLAPWAPIYNRGSNTGWVVNAARPIQQRNRSRKTKEESNEDALTASSSDLSKDEIEAMALIIPINKATVKMEILHGMARSFSLRQEERRKGEAISYFLLKYIHFTSYGGEVISEEYIRMNPSGQDMLLNFQKISSKVLQLEEKRTLQLNHDVSVMRCLMLISQHLPHDIPKKKDSKSIEKTWADEEDLMVILKAKDDIDGYATDRVLNSTSPVQPYLVLVESDLQQKKILKYFLVLDSKPMELSSINPASPHACLQSFDMLMKAFVVFNVEHPFGWRNTLHFVQHFLCGVREMWTSRGRRSLASPSQIELWNKLQAA